jgi:hypothetical protein
LLDTAKDRLGFVTALVRSNPQSIDVSAAGQPKLNPIGECWAPNLLGPFLHFKR